MPNFRTAAASLKHFLVGNPLKTAQAVHERLNKKTALAVFSSDALSSTAYATEEILLVLAVAAAYGEKNAWTYVLPITIGIAMLLTIVAISYRQTIHAYPSGGPSNAHTLNSSSRQKCAFTPSAGDE